MLPLLKGFEVEMYTGHPHGEVVGLADQITRDLPGFVKEPDRRNVEYITPPLPDYHALVCELLRPRQRLRHYLAGLGNLTILPGSTLALGGSDHFQRWGWCGCRGRGEKAGAGGLPTKRLPLAILKTDLKEIKAVGIQTRGQQPVGDRKLGRAIKKIGTAVNGIGI